MIKCTSKCKAFSLELDRKIFSIIQQTVKSSTLRNAAVLVLGLHHLDGIILQVEINVTLSNSVGLILSLRHCLLKVCFKAQSLEKQCGSF